MRAALAFLLLLLLGCLPQTQPHHEAPEEALRQRVRSALQANVAELGLEPLPQRELDWQATLLAQFARDAAPAYQALVEGRLADAALQEFARSMVGRLRERQGADAQPPTLLSHLMEQTPPLEPGERVLLLGMINRLVNEGYLELSDTELRFLGRAVPRAPSPQP